MGRKRKIITLQMQQKKQLFVIITKKDLMRNRIYNDHIKMTLINYVRI